MHFEKYLCFAATVVFLCAHCGCGPTESGTVVSVKHLTSTTVSTPTIGKTLMGESDALDPERDSEQAEDLVKDWDKPDVTLFISGRQHGYIEPCGCTGLTNQKGGLMRRHACQKILLDRGWDLVNIDAGNQVRRFGQQPVIKLQKTYDAFCKSMKYDSVGFGPDDLKLATIDLVQVMLNAQEGDNPFTCANIQIMGDDSMSNLFRIVERNGKRIGITAVIGNEHLEKLKNKEDIQYVDVERALAHVVKRMQAQKCDLMVLTAQTSLENCREIAQKFPVFDLLITAGGAGDPTLLPEPVKSSGKHVTHMIQVGVKGMYVGLVGLYTSDGRKQIRYKRVPLDHRFKDSAEMVDLFKSYQKDLQAIYLQGANEDIRPRQHESGYKFVGSEACMDCHLDEYEIWEDGVDGDGGPHVHATESLLHPPERSDIPRNFDPECLSCHVTGWNPQNFFPYESGFLDLKKHQHLHGNGCENCHGPGSAHIDAEENGDNQQLMNQLRAAMRLTVEQAEKKACMECHDLDNSPDFLKDGAFKKYWAKIEH